MDIIVGFALLLVFLILAAVADPLPGDAPLDRLSPNLLTFYRH